MNERFKELYNQSLEEKYQYGGSDAKPGEMYSNYITVLNPDKFAQLIVKDCVDLFEVEWGEEKLTGNDVGRVLKKHFGVEE